VGNALRAVTRFARGPRRAPIVFRGHTFEVSICYEDILRESFRESVLDARPDLLVNITSDSWFAGSAAPDLHLALATLRAVEPRRYLLRATNTGLSAAIAPTGEIVWRLPEDKVAAGVVSVHYLRADTLYERWGDLPWTIFVVSGAIIVALRCLAGHARIARLRSARPTASPLKLR
jgi:apolipoprotein N-acyltransferase